MAESATTAGERRVLADAPSGELVDLSDLSDEERVVSPDVIRGLCVGPKATEVDPRGIWIKGAHIEEPLDLSFCTVPHPLRFEATTFDATPDLNWAHIPGLWIEDCSLPGLWADGIRVDDLRLGYSVVSGRVGLQNAKIGGQLACPGTTLSNEGGTALSADLAEITGAVLLGDGFSATGEVRLAGARIGGQLGCRGATLTNGGGYALLADGADIAGGVFLGDGFSATGEVGFGRAKIGHQLACWRATLTNGGGSALSAIGADIAGAVFLGDGFSATGEVGFRRAKIDGQLSCSGATLTNGGGYALSADAAEITGGVFLGDGFSATGAVQLSGAKIDGQLVCSGATLANEGGDALLADGADITADVFLDDGFSATGAVRLIGAKIGGQFYCSGARFTNRTGPALNGRDVAIGGALIFRNTCVKGGVSLRRATATALEDDLGEMNDPCAGNDPSLAVRNEPRLGSWRGIDPLVLDGFTYSRFGQNTNGDSSLRRDWLKCTSVEQPSGFQQGAWQQLIEVYRAQGRDDDATRAAIAMHNDRVKRAGLPWFSRWGRQVLRVTVGHGYRPWLAGVWAAAIIAAFALVVWQWSGMFIPETDLTGSPQPVAYAVDTFLPIVDLGEAGDWMPTGWVRWVDWSVILSGWALTTLFVAGFTRIVRS